ncbi:hypothetical protein [Oleomonas cavernae]|nr:hypothetical protein [Oleomonas cavernae]
MSFPYSIVPVLDRALRSARETKLYDEALIICDGYCNDNPTDANGYSARSILLSMKKDPMSALADRDRAIRLRAGAPAAGDYSSRGRLLMELRRWREAIEAWKAVSALDHTGWFESYPALMQAECHLLLGEIEAAEAICEEIPDDYTFPGFRGLLAGSKFEILDDIATIRRGRHPRP